MSHPRLVTRDRIFTPGPVALLPEVERAGLFPVGYHRSAEFKALTLSCKQKLKLVMGCAQLPVLLACSGSGAMQAVVENFIPPGKTAVVIDAGKFGQRWAEISETLGVCVERYQLAYGAALDLEDFSSYFVGLTQVKAVHAVMFQGCETSTATSFPVEEVAKRIQKISPNSLVLVDGISSVGSRPYDAEGWGIDALISASQKGFGVPPGLAMVGLSNRAVGSFSSERSYYFDLSKEFHSQEDGTTAYTPATQLIYLLDIALSTLQERGLQDLYQVQKQAGLGIRRACQTLGLEVFSKSPSESVTGLVLPEGMDAPGLIKALKSLYRMQVSGGQGQLKGSILRIAHMGAIDLVDLMGCVLALETELKKRGWQSSHKFGEAGVVFWQTMQEL